MLRFNGHGIIPYGLNGEAVRESKRLYGENIISKRKSKGFFLKLLENFGDPLIKILLIALGINVIFLFKNSEWYETAIIAAAILIATVVSTVSELGSEAAFKKLQAEAARITCRVIRSGVVSELPVTEIVVGDYVKLQAGDRVPADGYLTEGALDADQSSLNGESREAQKTAYKGVGEYIAEGDFFNKNRLFSGTVVCSGEGIMTVTAVGDKTFYGKLAGELQESNGSSPMKERLNELAKSISRFGYIGAALVALAYLFNAVIIENSFDPILISAFLSDKYTVVTKLLYAVTLAVTVIVMAVPEGLPMMITVVLTSNMKKMMKDNVIVRKLVGIETAGSLNILFCDKTGTLTEGKLHVTGFTDGEGRLWNSGDALYSRSLWLYLHHSLFYNNSSSVSGGVAVGGNSTDRTLMEYAERHSVAENGVRYTNVIPFSSDLKYMATELKGSKICKGEKNGFTLIKGAPEMILPYCSEYIDADGETKTFVKRRLIEERIADMQKNAFRIIAVAVSTDTLKPSAFKNLRLIGIVSVRDDIREEAREGVKQIQTAGIQIVMITGDAKKTAEAIAGEVGLFDIKNPVVMTSDELNGLTDAQVKKVLPNLRVLARALPSDKSRLVRIAQSAGLVAGMTGDGVNDAPALKRADVSFAMGSGTEVAKEAGDIVIMDDNLLSIAKAVRYGRTIFKSIRKFIIFQLTLNFCAMGISMLAPLFGIASPITVVQILWINMVMDTLAGLAFGGEPPLKQYMKEPPKRRDEKIINKYMWLEIILGGAFSVLICMWFLNSDFVGKIFYYNRNVRFYTAFFGLFMFMGILNSFCARTDSVNLADHIAGNKPFIIIMGAVTLVQVVILYYGGQIFRTNGLSAYELLFIWLLSFGAIAANIARKFFYKIFKLKNIGV
ncbi:MAG: calcium-translocating P-type ATPase, PMCA-type [Clostridiales bacterium]|jgi:calcium-translocating P-type ATPase|nr:calcium-translocating P-type ATPase, PMCA-type [Clostridiales bacterium]